MSSVPVSPSSCLLTQQHLIEQVERLSQCCSEQELKATRALFFSYSLQSDHSLGQDQTQIIIEKFREIEKKFSAKRTCKLVCKGLHFYISSIFVSNSRLESPLRTTLPSMRRDLKISLYRVGLVFLERKIYDRIKNLVQMHNVNVNQFFFRDDFTEKTVSLYTEACFLRSREVHTNNMYMKLMFQAGANPSLPRHADAFWNNQLFLDEELFNTAIDHGLCVNGICEPEIKRAASREVAIPCSIVSIINAFDERQDIDPHILGDIGFRVHALRIAIFRGLTLTDAQKKEFLARFEGSIWTSIFNPGDLWDTAIRFKEEAERENQMQFLRSLEGISEETKRQFSPLFDSNSHLFQIVSQYLYNIHEVQKIYLSKFREQLL